MREKSLSHGRQQGTDGVGAGGRTRDLRDRYLRRAGRIVVDCRAACSRFAWDGMHVTWSSWLGAAEVTRRHVCERGRVCWGGRS
jgi:hypothetical protein